MLRGWLVGESFCHRHEDLHSNLSAEACYILQGLVIVFPQRGTGEAGGSQESGRLGIPVCTAAKPRGKRCEDQHPGFPSYLHTPTLTHII